MPEPKAYTKTLDELLSSNLSIPEYQRPYSWTEKQIGPLLLDLHIREKDEALIMGGIILHNDQGTIHDRELNIVDGQQRLVTYSIIKSLCESNFTVPPNWNFPHAISIENIQNNARFIRKFIERKGKLMLDNIHFIVVETSNLDDAFAFFDSQNTRGKKLEDYDILKAHHLRFIKNDQLATMCAKSWEKTERNENIGLGYLLETFLARGRTWTNNIHSRPDIKTEFKSQRTEKREATCYALNGYQQAAVYNSWSYNPVEKDSIRFNLKSLDASFDGEGLEINSNVLQFLPFQITQNIEGGELFFWYTQKYHALASELFLDNNEENTETFISLFRRIRVFSYNTGTAYVSDLLKGALLFYFDKFGYAQLDKVADNLFRCIFWLRMRQATVQYASIFKFVREDFNPFSLIKEASYPEYIHHRCADFLEGKYNDVERERGIRAQLWNEFFHSNGAAVSF